MHKTPQHERGAQSSDRGGRKRGSTGAAQGLSRFVRALHRVRRVNARDPAARGRHVQRQLGRGTAQQGTGSSGLASALRPPRPLPPHLTTERRALANPRTNVGWARCLVAALPASPSSPPPHEQSRVPVASAPKPPLASPGVTSWTSPLIRLCQMAGVLRSSSTLSLPARVDRWAASRRSAGGKWAGRWAGSRPTGHSQATGASGKQPAAERTRQVAHAGQRRERVAVDGALGLGHAARSRGGGGGGSAA